MALNMDRETIDEIVLNSNNELLLKIMGKSKPMYQYIYREDAGVYWDDDNKGFKSTLIKKDKSISEWFFHITDIAKSGLALDLTMGENPSWENIPDTENNKIIKNALLQFVN